MTNRQQPLTELKPNLADINAHLFALFAPEFVRHPDAWIEIAFARPDGKLNEAQIFSAFELKAAAEFAEAKNMAGFNIYVSAALRVGKHPRTGRANADDHFHAARFAWIEYDGAGDHERVTEICKAEGLRPAMLAVTGTAPHLREHLYFLMDSPITDADELVAINSALRDRFGSDAVQDAARVLRLAGTINYPSKDKAAKGYIIEQTTLRVQRDAPGYSVEALCGLSSTTSSPSAAAANSIAAYGEARAPKTGKSDEELIALLKKSRATPGKGWREPMVLGFIPSTINKGWSDIQIRLAAAPYSDGGVDDPEIQKEIDYARKKFGKPNPGNDDDAAEPPAPPQRFLTLDQWRERDLPPRDLLLGEAFSTTSRALLFAKTGLGKTNVALALGMRMSAGIPFLHWAGHRTSKVMYIDGEMSRSLLKERLIAEEARMLKEIGERVRDEFKPDGFHALNTEDIEAFPPLNTRQGQAAIDRIISEIGGIDFIIFDNIMSLVPGSMRDEEPWQKTMSWVRGLTKRRIGQLWIHHANDEDKAYGDKTRMWEMDAVIALTEVKSDGTDISFNLSFEKARERKPENRDDFADTYVCLTGDRWRCDSAVAKPSKPPSPMAIKYLEALTNVVASGGGEKTMRLHGLVAVHNDDWKAECSVLGLLDTEGSANSQRAKFSANRAELVAANKVACEGHFTWLR